MVSCVACSYVTQGKHVYQSAKAVYKRKDVFVIFHMSYILDVIYYINMHILCVYLFVCNIWDLGNRTSWVVMTASQVDMMCGPKEKPLFLERFTFFLLQQRHSKEGCFHCVTSFTRTGWKQWCLGMGCGYFSAVRLAKVTTICFRM